MAGPPSHWGRQGSAACDLANSNQVLQTDKLKIAFWGETETMPKSWFAGVGLRKCSRKSEIPKEHFMQRWAR